VPKAAAGKPPGRPAARPARPPAPRIYPSAPTAD